MADLGVIVDPRVSMLNQIVEDLVLFNVSTGILLEVPALRFTLIGESAELLLGSISHVVHVVQPEILVVERLIRPYVRHNSSGPF